MPSLGRILTVRYTISARECSSYYELEGYITIRILSASGTYMVNGEKTVLNSARLSVRLLR
jgi:hypothetical protein